MTVGAEDSRLVANQLASLEGRPPFGTVIYSSGEELHLLHQVNLHNTVLTLLINDNLLTLLVLLLLPYIFS